MGSLYGNSVWELCVGTLCGNSVWELCVWTLCKECGQSVTLWYFFVANMGGSSSFLCEAQSEKFALKLVLLKIIPTHNL